jgi:MFS family permease
MIGRGSLFYGWIVVALAFVTMGIGVTVTRAFSLLFPSLLNEFGWAFGLTAGAFSVGTLVSTIAAPFLGRLMDRHGPRRVMLLGAMVVGSGLLLAELMATPGHLYLTLGLLVSGGSVAFGYTAHALFLPNWFVRRRGFAMGLAFSGVGVGSIVLLPWMERVVLAAGWRVACFVMALLVFALGLLNLLQRLRPEDIGSTPDGDATGNGRPTADPRARIVDAAWASVDWTLRRVVVTTRFWWIALGFLTSSFAWYGMQVHQTQYLIEVGFVPATAVWALGLVAFAGIAGQITVGYLSDRVGREWAWSVGSAGFVCSYAALLLMHAQPMVGWLYVMIAAQGFLGYGLTAVYGTIPAEIFQGRHYGTIFGTLSVASGVGAALGPWVTGVLHDLTGDYVSAFWVAMGCCVVSAVAIWRAGPRRVRVVAGRLRQGENTAASEHRRLGTNGEHSIAAYDAVKLRSEGGNDGRTPSGNHTEEVPKAGVRIGRSI